MEISIKDIAEHFSKGEFDKTNEFLNKNIIWNVVGETIFKGQKEVLENCEQTAAYFKTVETDFQTTDILEFNKDKEIVKIDSYCISEKKN